MKIKTRSDDADMLETSELFQMNGWLAELRDEGRAESRDEDRSGVEENGYFTPPRDRRADSGNGSRTASPPDSRARPRDDTQVGLPRGGYPRPEALAAVPATRPVTRTQPTARAVIGDELRLPIMWCEMGSCISWFAHPAALGEADIRARAIDAGWRVDAVGLLICPQCEQTAPGFQSPLPVVPWDREEAIAMPAQMADEPSAEAVASVARELSHDLRCPASDHRDEVGAPSAWIAAVPADDATRSVSEATRDEVRQPSDDHQPENHLRPGRHRKRLTARLSFASH